MTIDDVIKEFRERKRRKIMTEVIYTNNNGKPLGYDSGMTKEERINKERDHTMCDFVTDALGIKLEETDHVPDSGNMVEADLSKLTTKDLGQCQYDIPCPNLECENAQCMCDRMGEWMIRHAAMRSLVKRLTEGLEDAMRKNDINELEKASYKSLITEGREALK